MWRRSRVGELVIRRVALSYRSAPRPATQRLKTVQERGVLAIRQKETVVVIDIVRGAPSQAAFSVIADR